MIKKISIVTPVYNEESNIENFLNRLVSILKKIDTDYEIVFVLDPSTDDTEKTLLKFIKNDRKIKLIKLSRRFGQPAATMAGIQNISGDRCVIIDCDLQDPPELIYEMNLKMNEGFDAVLARRKSRKGETLFKKIVTMRIENEKNSLSANELQKISSINKINTITGKSFYDSLKKISSNEKKLIVCFGSLYNCGNILNKN